MKIERTLDSELERRARVVLPGLLAQVPGLTIQQVLTEVPARPISYPDVDTIQHRNYRPDLKIEVSLSSEQDSDTPQASMTRWLLYVEVTSQVSERKLQVIASYARNLPQAIPVLFVPHLSAEALATCRTNGVCCADAAGNGWIVLGSRVYIERIGNKALAIGKDHSTPPLSSPKTENVLRVLLNAAGANRRIWRLQPLALEANVSLGQAARVKGILDEMGVTEEQSSHRRIGGFRLTHPEEVLQEWAGYVRARSYRAGEEHTFHSIDEPLELQRMLTRKLPSFVTDRFALTCHQAADFYATYARSPVFSAYVVPDQEIDIDTLEEAMDLDRVLSGVNVVLTIPRDPGVCYLPPDLRESAHEKRLMEGKVPVVSPVQTYLDLQRLDGRAREGAQYLLEQYLRPRWQKEIKNDD